MAANNYTKYDEDFKKSLVSLHQNGKTQGLSRILCKVQTRVQHGSCGERFCSLLFQYNRNKAKNQALVRQPVSEKYLQLGMDNAPIPALACPFFRDVHHRQIQHFQQAVIGRKHGF